MTQFKIFLWITQAPNTVMQICRNKGATKASRKTVMTMFLKFLQKRSFLSKKMVIPLKQSLSHQSIHWY